MKGLKGKVAVVTASTEGIGYAIAERLGEEGAKVVVSSRKARNVDQTVETLKNKGIDVFGIVCHVGNKDHRHKLLKETAEKFGGIDILVCNAGINPYFGTFLETPEETWDKLFDINLKATFLLIRDAVPYMEKRGGGAVVLNSSVGAYSPNSMLGTYSVTKTAMLGLAKALAPQLAERNIRINSIAPGIIATKFSQALTSNPGVMEHLKTIPMKRPGKAQECAGVAALLASDDASYMTGETIVIAGGTHARL